MTDDIYGLVDQLINLGEDRDELQFWLDIYPYLNSEEKDKLLDNLQNEIKKLK